MCFGTPTGNSRRFLFEVARLNQFVVSPCVSVCEVDERDICVGCLRTLDEIAAWGAMSHEARMHVMTVLLPQREAEREG